MLLGLGCGCTIRVRTRNQILHDLRFEDTNPNMDTDVGAWLRIIQSSKSRVMKPNLRDIMLKA